MSSQVLVMPPEQPSDLERSMFDMAWHFFPASVLIVDI